MKRNSKCERRRLVVASGVAILALTASFGCHARRQYPKDQVWLRAESPEILQKARTSGGLTAEEQQVLEDCALAEIMKDTGKLGASIRLPNRKLARDVVEPYGQMKMEGETLGEILDEAAERKRQWLAHEEAERQRRVELLRQAGDVLKFEGVSVRDGGLLMPGFPVAYGKVRNITRDKTIKQLQLRIDFYDETGLSDVKIKDVIGGQDPTTTAPLKPGEVRDFYEGSLSWGNRLSVEIEHLMVL